MIVHTLRTASPTVRTLISTHIHLENIVTFQADPWVGLGAYLTVSRASHADIVLEDEAWVAVSADHQRAVNLAACALVGAADAGGTVQGEGIDAASAAGIVGA